MKNKQGMMLLEQLISLTIILIIMTYFFSYLLLMYHKREALRLDFEKNQELHALVRLIENGDPIDDETLMKRGMVIHEDEVCITYINQGTEKTRCLSFEP